MRTSLPLVGLFLLSCSAPPRAPSPPPSPVRDALLLPRELGAPGATILLGELHGTRELPSFVARLVTQLAAARPVVLGLEIHPDQLPSLATYLASDGGKPARDAALRDPWWHSTFQDGRRSVAMFELIETARALRAGGARVDVTCFDRGAREGGTADDREESMARDLLAVRRARPEATLVVFAGNLHTRRALRPGRSSHDWMAMRLATAGVAFVTLDARYADGSAWNCMGSQPGDCGPHSAGGRGDERGIHLERSEDGGHDGWYGVGPITASPPAALPELAVGLDAKLAALREAGARRAASGRAYEAKDYARCAAELDQIDGATAGDAYNQACCLALKGDKDAAFDRLRTAIERGFKDFDHASKDPDLASLHADPRWPPWPAR
jgi:hypothetical protein